MVCRHWKKYPEDSDEPKCAFYPSGKFKYNNWNCALMNELRELFVSTSVFYETTGKLEAVWNEDEWCGIIPLSNPCRWAILVWYKGRGRIEAFYMMEMDFECGLDTWKIRDGTEKDAKHIIEEYKAKKVSG